MPCGCEQCLKHAKTLGLPETPPSKADLHKAYRQAAKLWHPDRHLNDTRAQAEAAERFKLVQVAYRELSLHHEDPVDLPPEDTFASAEMFAKASAAPTISFSGAAGCFTAAEFTPAINRVIASHLGRGHMPVAIVDIGGVDSAGEGFSKFLLLAGHAVVVRGSLGVVSFLWYTELGEVRIVDRRKHGKTSILQKIADRFLGPRQNYSLQIFRRNGTHFYTLAEAPDDSVKKVIYNFLLRKKHEAHS
jgi:hypothetical protein